MNYQRIIYRLEKNKDVFNLLLKGTGSEEYLWRQEPEKWCLLEIICHLYDEEREDFRARLKCTLEKPGAIPPPIDPVARVKERNYIGQNYQEMLDKFLEERAISVHWLQSLDSPDWNSSFEHPSLGIMTARLFLSSWLAHDYLHIRQILKLQYDYLKETSGEDLTYAGVW